MVKSLLDQAVSKKQREVAGSDSAARFDYQRDWAFCKLLELHEADKDYLIAFEFHDDVVLFDSELSPSSVEFFQIKTKREDKSVGLAKFTKKSPKGGSILGKLFGNLLGICKTHPIRLYLVSNRPYSFSAGNNTCASQLKKADKAKVLLTLKNELPSLGDSVLEKLYFCVTDIGLDNIQIHLEGRTVKLFKKRFGENGAYNIFSWIRLVQGEIKRKNNHLSDSISTLQELKTSKCLGKKFIDDTLDRVEQTHRNAPDLQLIKSRLQSENWPLADLLRLDKAIPEAVSDYQDPSNQECQKLIEFVVSILETCDLEQTPLSNLLETVCQAAEQENKIHPPYTKMYLCALTLMVFNEKL